MIWELAVSCGLVLVGHARTLYRVHRVNTAADTYESTLAINIASYSGPLKPDVKAAKQEITHTYDRGNCRCESCTRNKRWNKEARRVNEMTAALDREVAYYLAQMPYSSPEAAIERGELKLPTGAHDMIVSQPPFTRKQLVEMSYEELVRNVLIPSHERARVQNITNNLQRLYEDAMVGMLTTHWCEKCGRTSHNPNDVKHSYCGSCHHFCKEAPDCDPTLLHRHRDDWTRS